MYELGSAKTEASVIYIGNSGGVKRRLQAHKRGDDGSCTKNAAYYRVDYRSDYRTLDMRLEGLAGSYMTWCIGDPIASGGWGIRDELARLDRKRPKKGSNDDWTHPQDPDAKITKMKDGSDEPGPHRPDQRRYLLTAPSRVLILAA